MSVISTKRNEKNHLRHDGMAISLNDIVGSNLAKKNLHYGRGGLSQAGLALTLRQGEILRGKLRLFAGLR